MTDISEKPSALQQALEFVVMFLAFTGRDESTAREAQTMKSLTEMAVKLDADLRQAIENPSAGTSAYQMLADVEQANVDTTETLIHMVAATVMMKGIEPNNGIQVFGQADGAYSVTLSPADLDAMHRTYDMDATRDGMLTIVRIIPKTAAEMDPPVSLYVQDGDDPAIEAEPQAEGAVYDRPIWAIRYSDKEGKPYLAAMHDRRDAERHIQDYDTPGQADPTIENRHCLHSGCPAERCNLEVTSDS